MKKIKLKKILVSCMIGIMALAVPLFVGCNKIEEPIKTDAEAYVMLKEFVEDFKVVNSQNSYENLIDMGKQQEKVFNFENSDLLPSTIATLQSMGMQDESTNFNRRREFYLNKNDNTGFYIHKIFNYETLTYDIQDFDVTKIVDNKYVNYSFSKTDINKCAAYVDNEYAKNVYVYENFSKDSSEIYNIFNSIKANNSYESFLSNSKKIAKDILSQSAKTEIDENDLQVSVNIEAQNKDYVFTGLITGDNLLLESDEYSSNYANVNAVFTIAFNESGIISSGANMKFEQFSTIKSIMYSAMLESNNANIDINDTIQMNAVVDMHFNMNFEASLNNRDLIMDNDYDNFNGLGQDGEIQNKKTNITINFINVNSKIEKEYQWGDYVDLTLSGCPVNTSEGVIIDGLYWDEACTDEIEQTDKYPSYDTTIYVKIRPDEGRALVNKVMYYYVGSDEEYSDNGLYEVYLVQQDVNNYAIVHGKIFDETLELTKLIVNDVEVSLVFNGDGNVEIPIENGKIYLIQAYYTEVVNP